MEDECAILGCPSRGLMLIHQFPTNKKTCKAWVDILKKYNPSFSASPTELLFKRLCYRHFSADAYIGLPLGSELRRWTVPTLFLDPGEKTNIKLLDSCRDDNAMTQCRILESLEKEEKIFLNDENPIRSIEYISKSKPLMYKFVPNQRVDIAPPRHIYSSDCQDRPDDTINVFHTQMINDYYAQSFTKAQPPGSNIATTGFHHTDVPLELGSVRPSVIRICVSKNNHRVYTQCRR